MKTLFTTWFILLVYAGLVHFFIDKIFGLLTVNQIHLLENTSILAFGVSVILLLIWITKKIK